MTCQSSCWWPRMRSYLCYPLFLRFPQPWQSATLAAPLAAPAYADSRQAYGTNLGFPMSTDSPRLFLEEQAETPIWRAPSNSGLSRSRLTTIGLPLPQALSSWPDDGLDKMTIPWKRKQVDWNSQQTTPLSTGSNKSVLSIKPPSPAQPLPVLFALTPPELTKGITRKLRYLSCCWAN